MFVLLFSNISYGISQRGKEKKINRFMPLGRFIAAKAQNVP